MQSTETDYPCLFFRQGQTKLPQTFAQYLIKPFSTPLALKGTYEIIRISAIICLAAMRFYHFLKPLILTRDSVLEYLGEVTIAPITTTVRDIPSEVFLSTADGLPQDCAVNCDHLQTVSKVGHLSFFNAVSW